MTHTRAPERAERAATGSRLLPPTSGSRANTGIIDCYQRDPMQKRKYSHPEEEQLEPVALIGSTLQQVMDNNDEATAAKASRQVEAVVLSQAANSTSYSKRTRNAVPSYPLNAVSMISPLACNATGLHCYRSSKCTSSCGNC